MTEDRGLIDTSVAVDIRSIDVAVFPAEVAISTLTLGELAAGPHAARDELTRARRQSHLEFVEANLEALAFDPACARAYGVVCAALGRKGRKARGGRAVDMMIAATALAHGLPLYTRNARDLHGLEDMIEIIAVGG